MTAFGYTNIAIGAVPNDGNGTPARDAANDSINPAFIQIFASMSMDSTTFDVSIDLASTTTTLLTLQGDSLTTGSVLKVLSNNASASHSGPLMHLINDFNGTGNAALMEARQDDDGQGIVIRDGRAIFSKMLVVEDSGGADKCAIKGSGVIEMTDVGQSLDFLQSGAINIDANNDQSTRTLRFGYNGTGASSTEIMSLHEAGGQVMVGATGGDQGIGTINATAVYDDGVLLTCYVTQAAQGGDLTDEEWDAFALDRVTKGLPKRKIPKTEIKIVEKKEVEMIDGVAVLKTVSKDVEVPVTEEHLVFKPNGDPEMYEVKAAIEGSPALYDSNQNLVREEIKAEPAVMKQRIYRCSVMIDAPAVPDEITVRQHEGMRKFRARLGGPEDPLDIDKYAAHWKAKNHLTSYPNKANFDPEKGLSIGEWQQRGVETDEILAILIEQLNQRLKAINA